MPGASQISRGNQIIDTLLYLPSVTVPNVNANSSASQTVTVNGVLVGDMISWSQQGVIAGLSVDNVYVSAANTLSFYWTNTTGSNITSSAAQAFLIELIRSDVLPYTTLPSALE
jgi:hypothetical protein